MCCGHSVGGYTASCAAMSYPEIGAVVSRFHQVHVHVHVRVTLCCVCAPTSCVDIGCQFRRPLSPHSKKDSPSSWYAPASLLLLRVQLCLPLSVCVCLVSLTHGMVREYYDLNIAEQMCRYVTPM